MRMKRQGKTNESAKNYAAEKFMKLSKLYVLALLIFALAGAAQTAAQKKLKPSKKKIAAPRTVYDFYQKIPANYFPFLKRLKDRRDFVEANDEKNDYLRFGANVPFPPEHAEMALLKRLNGGFYVVISYTDDENEGVGVLRFLEYENGKFTEAQGASKIDWQAARAVYRRKTGRDADANEYLFYRIEPTSKTITVRLGDTEIYRSE